MFSAIVEFGTSAIGVLTTFARTEAAVETFTGVEGGRLAKVFAGFSTVGVTDVLTF